MSRMLWYRKATYDPVSSVYLWDTSYSRRSDAICTPDSEAIAGAVWRGNLFWHIRELCLVGGLPSGKEALPPRHTANFFHADGTSRVVTLVFSSHVESATT